MSEINKNPPVLINVPYIIPFFRNVRDQIRWYNTPVVFSYRSMRFVASIYPHLS